MDDYTKIHVVPERLVRLVYDLKLVFRIAGLKEPAAIVLEPGQVEPLEAMLKSSAAIVQPSNRSRPNPSIWDVEIREGPTPGDVARLQAERDQARDEALQLRRVLWCLVERAEGRVLLHHSEFADAIRPGAVLVTMPNIDGQHIEFRSEGP